MLAGVLALAAAACSAEEAGEASGTDGLETQDPGDCIVVDLSVSSEKIDLLSELAREFNDSDAAQVDDRCVFARVQSKPSGGAAQLLSGEWDEDVEGPRPVTWSPAASSWGAVLNQPREAQGAPATTGSTEARRVGQKGVSR